MNGDGLEGTGAPVGFNAARDGAGGHRYHRDTALLTPPLQHQGIFLTAKKIKKIKKSQAKNVINIRANSGESGRSQGSAASTQKSSARLEVTQSTGGITPRIQHQSCCQPSPAAQGALHSSLCLSLSEAANFSQTTCQLTKPFVLL